MALSAQRQCLRLLPLSSGSALSSTSTSSSAASPSPSSTVPSTSPRHLYQNHQYRSYATSLNTSPSATSKTRRRVTAFNDDGRVPWGQLSPAEKAARTAQQSVNLTVVVVGGLATVGVAYLLWGQVFSTDSKTAHFNRAFDELRDNDRVIELLGPADKLVAHGEGSWSKWSRNRTIASTVTQDGAGRDHLMMQFYVEGPKNKARVNLHMVRPDVSEAFVYKSFTVQVPGHSTIQLRNDKVPGDSKGGFRFLGVSWGNSSGR